MRCAHNRVHEEKFPNDFNYVDNWNEITPKLLSKL